jgi:hypothetical protein
MERKGHRSFHPLSRHHRKRMERMAGHAADVVPGPQTAPFSHEWFVFIRTHSWTLETAPRARVPCSENIRCIRPIIRCIR